MTVDQTTAEQLKESIQQTQDAMTNEQKIVDIEQQIFADKTRYKAVVGQFLDWNAMAHGENKDAGLAALVHNAQNAIMSEGLPLPAPPTT